MKTLFCILHGEASLMAQTQGMYNIEIGIEKIGDSKC
jgi:hypothetical protein